MSDQDKINAIIQAIQSDTTLLILLRQMVTNNIINVPPMQLNAICALLGISTS